MPLFSQFLNPTSLTCSNLQPVNNLLTCVTRSATVLKAGCREHTWLRITYMRDSVHCIFKIVFSHILAISRKSATQKGHLPPSLPGSKVGSVCGGQCWNSTFSFSKILSCQMPASQSVCCCYSTAMKKHIS